jgi:hypothetical protein
MAELRRSGGDMPAGQVYELDLAIDAVTGSAIRNARPGWRSQHGC